jgi:glutaryl-CoA dehydrogenase
MTLLHPPKVQPNGKPPLPKPDSDFYQINTLLSPQDRELMQRVRTFMETTVHPIITRYWTNGEFPFEVIPGLQKLNVCGLGLEGYGCAGGSSTLSGYLMMELGRVDCSIATFMAVHSGLAMTSIYLCGSEEQKQRWLPPMARLELIGSFGLTEPEVGSGAAGGLTTTARRDGDFWVLSGEKMWIGNATFSDVNIVWARDVADNQVKGFIVEKGTPGFVTEKIQNKIALRAVQNAHITMTDCRISEANRLQKAGSFRSTADVLRMTRAGVAWEAVGCQMGAYENALAYAQKRRQFGRPIGSFQLVQDLLFRMLANVTASQCVVLRLSQMQDAGTLKDEHASLAKAFCTVKMRETVGWARELMGGNGVLLEYNVGRFVADAEALYSYEGTREINALIVGRAITGFSAFV